MEGEWPDDIISPRFPIPVCHQWKTLTENEFFQRGKKDEKRSNFPSAIRHYSATLHLNPKYSRAYNRRGNAKYIQGDRVNAEKDWRLAATFASPEFDETMTVAEAKIIKSKILVVEANYEKALEEAAAAIEADPTNADAYHQRGFVKSFTGDISGEIEDFSKCIELKLRLNPFDAYNAYNNRGLAYQDREEWDEAIRDHTEAIRLQPSYGIAYKHRGKAYRCSGELSLSLNDLTKALGTNPKDVDALVERSYTYYELGQPANAMVDCEAAIAIDPLCHDAFTVKAGLMADVGDSEGAIEILTGLLDQAPDAFTFRFRAELRILRQDFEGAKSDYRRCLELDPTDEDVRTRLEHLEEHLAPPGNGGGRRPQHIE
ncbi:tetratricopeptide repeat domain containing protein [Acanthamoeba castellanii str. Neff]|uniref:Tetratricopeptide repeat domain containing protein n=1 Tax=Acanthamoeba castellanii (strain ATCC 30010 / Neff) TaxID=1257118 RepID=L8H2K0_ACACF|nr:tetratricopeptide repeat domain containing protein [Acanthamoeba castellanii str. Neff]ELR19734.1 tetratricopeptide repeat domain containing protein [Acanthamoeba castellanii str. Neff]